MHRDTEREARETGLERDGETEKDLVATNLQPCLVGRPV